MAMMDSSGDKGLILLIEDDTQMQRLLRIILQGYGYSLVESATGQEGLMQAATRAPDIVLLDLGLPDIDGLEVTRRLREWSDVPIIVISAREQEQDKIKALDAGADDYLTKPFGTGELMARIRAALRRLSRPENEPIIQVKKLKIDLARRLVAVAETEVSLTPTEY